MVKYLYVTLIPQNTTPIFGEYLLLTAFLLLQNLDFEIYEILSACM